MIHRIIDPPAFRTINHQPGIFQDPKMKRQPGLTGMKRVGQVADTMLSFSQSFQDSDPRLIRERMEDTHGLFKTF
jgi:hypothetical protein